MTELATAAAKVTLRLPLLPLAEVVVSVSEHRPTEATVAMVVMEMTVAGRCRGGDASNVTITIVDAQCRGCAAKEVVVDAQPKR